LRSPPRRVAPITRSPPSSGCPGRRWGPWPPTGLEGPARTPCAPADAGPSRRRWWIAARRWTCTMPPSPPVCGARVRVAAPSGDPDLSPLQRRLTYPEDWLANFAVTLVGMESTGIYWRPVWQVPEDNFERWLLNAQHLHNVMWLRIARIEASMPPCSNAPTSRPAYAGLRVGAGRRGDRRGRPLDPRDRVLRPPARPPLRCPRRRLLAKRAETTISTPSGSSISSSGSATRSTSRHSPIAHRRSQAIFRSGAEH
jgi:hypothetical protein